MIHPAAIAWTKPIDAYLMLGRLANMASIIGHPAAGSLEHLQDLMAHTFEYELRALLTGWIHGVVLPGIEGHVTRVTPEMEFKARLTDPVLDQVCIIRDWLRKPDTLES